MHIAQCAMVVWLGAISFPNLNSILESCVSRSLHIQLSNTEYCAMKSGSDILVVNTAESPLTYTSQYHLTYLALRTVLIEVLLIQYLRSLLNMKTLTPRFHKSDGFSGRNSTSATQNSSLMQTLTLLTPNKNCRHLYEVHSKY